MFKRVSRPLVDYLSPEVIVFLATPANFRLGQEIAQVNGVEIIESSPLLVTARVQPKGGQRRSVELSSTEIGLKWKCTCTGTGLFCKHCVEAALTVGKRSL